VLRSADIPLDAVVFDWRGGQPGGITEVGSMTRVGTGPVTSVSFVDAYNQSFDPDLSSTTFVPTLRAAAPDPTDQVQSLVSHQAGAGKIGI
jgi:pectate lyase